MHVAAREFVIQAIAEYGSITNHVAELGSRDANGGIRDLFTQAASYVGVDITLGPNVDVVTDAAEWHPDHAYQCIVSTELFEHTPRWREILAVAVKALAPDGVMIITCATEGRVMHSATIPNKRPKPGEYYANVNEQDFRQAVQAAGLHADIVINTDHRDLYAVCRHIPPPTGGVRVIGAGMWRTGTVSLKSALERLTGQPCHHMSEVITHPHQASQWLAVTEGGPRHWQDILKGYAVTLDWPSMAFWRELSQAYPQALVLLSTRDPEDWWRSVSQTVLQSAPTAQNAQSPWQQLVVKLFDQSMGRFPTRDDAMAAYLAHNQLVRHTIPKNRLLEWQLGDDWLPLCRALDVPVPDQAFPHLNTVATYRRNNRLE